MPPERGRRLAAPPELAAQSPPARRRRRIVVAVLFAAFAVVELWGPVVQGRWLLPGDDGQAWPATHIANAPDRPHNGLTGDVYEGIAPFLRTDVTAVRGGHLPTWNPANGNGQPYLANGQSAVYSPFTLLFYVFSMRVALALAAVLKLWLLGFFTYLFLLRHRLGELAAVIGGVLFAYGGFHLIWLDYQNIVSASALLPVALWCTRVALDQDGGHRTGRRRRRQAMCALAAALGAMGLAGHPETFLFDGLLVGAYAVAAVMSEHRERTTRLRVVAMTAAAAAVGVGIAAAQLVPLWQYEADSARAAAAHSSPRQVVPGFPLDTASMAAFPNLFGGPQFAYYDMALYQRHERSNYAEVNAMSFGLAGLCLAPLGFSALATKRRRRRPRTALLVWFGAGALLVDGLLLYSRFVGTLWWHLPGVGSAVLNRSQDIALFGLAALAAAGVDWVVGDRRSDAAPAGERGRRLLVMASVFVVVTVVLLALGLHLRHVLVPGSPSRSIVSGNVAAELATTAVVALSVAVSCVASRAAVRAVAALAAAGAAFASNGLVLQSFNTTVGGSQVYPVTAAVRALQHTVGSSEALYAGGVFPWPDVNLWYGLGDVGSFDPLGLAWHDRLYRRVFHTASAGGNERMPACLGQLQLFGVRWVVGGDGRFTSPGQPALAPTTSADGIPLYRVPGSALASVVATSVVLGDERAQTALVDDCRFRPDETVVLDAATARDWGARPATPVAGGATAALQAESPRSLRFRVTAPGPAWLVVRQSWAPGWQAAVDGTPSSVARADVAFQAVAVPAGTHTVTLEYSPASVSAGAWASIAAGAIVVGVLAGDGAVAWIDRRRQQRPARRQSPLP